MRRGLIVINAYSRLESSMNQSRRLKEELERLGVEMDIVKNNAFLCSIEDNGIACYNSYDFCIYLDKDKYISEMLERSGMRLFNKHQAIQDCDDKMCTYIKLADRDINIVDTMGGLLCYNPEEEVSPETIDLIEKRFGYPIIVKECYGSLGKGVYKCDDRAKLTTIMNKLKLVPHLFQHFVESSEGRDIRAIVIGDKCVAAMERKSNTDFRSNLELGATGTKLTITSKIENIALKATRALGLDYAGVDLLFGENGEYIVCEVNSNAFFGGIERVTGVNIAKLYAEYIINEMYEKTDIGVLIQNIDRISISDTSVDRVHKNLGINIIASDIISLCKEMLLNKNATVYKQGKNWYITYNNVKFTVNASSYTIITATRVK